MPAMTDPSNLLLPNPGMLVPNNSNCVPSNTDSCLVVVLYHKSPILDEVINGCVAKGIIFPIVFQIAPYVIGVIP